MMPQIKQRQRSLSSRFLCIFTFFVTYFAGIQTGLISSRQTDFALLSPRYEASPAEIDPSFKLAYDQSYGFFDDITQYNWRLMQQRARTRIDHKFPDPLKFYDEPARWYMNVFEPDFTCAQERRVIGPGDGPKWVCDPHRLPKIVERRAQKMAAEKAGCLIYSVGSGGKWQFEDGMFEILNGLCEVHVFDPGNWAKDKSDLEEKNIHFHKWGLKSSYNGTYKPVVNYGEFFSLQETLEKLGHEGRTIDIFKIDCEYCEWFCFKDWFEVDIRMILVETHQLPEDMQTSLDFFYGFQNANFYLYHKEPNIHPMAKGEGIEWAYIRLHPDFLKNDTTTREV